METVKVILPVYGINTAALLNPEPLAPVISSDQIILPPEEERDTYQLPKGFTATGTVTITTTTNGDEEALNSISRLLHDSDNMVTLTPDGSSLPRKMKKALRQGQRYHRDTKWKRKAARWQQRHSVTLLGSWTEDDEGVTFRGKPIE
jgi:hypothetical protein